MDNIDNKLPEFEDVMVDIETTGLKPGCGIWQIGAVSSKEDFSYTINPMSLPDGFTFDSATTNWQEKSNTNNWAYALSMFPSSSSNLIDMLQAFSNWINRIRVQAETEDKKLRLWCKGTDFDFPILSHAMETVGIRPVYGHRETNDLRTLCNVMNSPVPQFAGAHSAIIDAREQHKHLLTLLARLP